MLDQIKDVEYIKACATKIPFCSHVKSDDLNHVVGVNLDKDKPYSEARRLWGVQADFFASAITAIDYTEPYPSDEKLRAIEEELYEAIKSGEMQEEIQKFTRSALEANLPENLQQFRDNGKSLSWLMKRSSYKPEPKMGLITEQISAGHTITRYAHL